MHGAECNQKESRIELGGADRQAGGRHPLQALHAGQGEVRGSGQPWEARDRPLPARHPASELDQVGPGPSARVGPAKRKRRTIPHSRALSSADPTESRQRFSFSRPRGLVDIGCRFTRGRRRTARRGTGRSSFEHGSCKFCRWRWPTGSMRSAKSENSQLRYRIWVLPFIWSWATVENMAKATRSAWADLSSRRARASAVTARR